MFLRSHLHRWKNGSFLPRTSRKRPWRGPTARPRLEVLEDRTLPTAVTILGSHLVTAGGLTQQASVSGVNVAVNGSDVTFDVLPFRDDAVAGVVARHAVYCALSS
jgi:hypothetical protein